MFHRTFAACSQDCQCPVAIGVLLSDYDPFQELWKDALDFIPFRILRGLSDRVALSVRAVHHCGGYVPELGDYQSRAMELLDNLLPALITIVILYIPALILGMISIVRKRMLSVRFIHRERRRAWVVLGVGLVSLGAAFLLDKKYEMTSDLYPVNVCYNVVLAVERNARTLDYEENFEGFHFQCRRHASGRRPGNLRTGSGRDFPCAQLVVVRL